MSRTLSKEVDRRKRFWRPNKPKDEVVPFEGKINRGRKNYVDYLSGTNLKLPLWW